MEDDAQLKQEKWNRSRTVMQIYLCFTAAILMGFYFYAHAIPYLQTYNANCNAPGVLSSQIWDWNFVIQSMYAVCFIPLIVIGFLMLINWYNNAPYICFVIWSLLVVAWMIATAIFLSWQAANANTCESVGNAASDLRICGRCGQIPEWNQICFNTAPYNPPLTDGLTMNTPRAFQLVFHWIMWALALIGLIYVPTEYLRAQRGYLPFLEGQREDVVVDDAEEEDEPNKEVPKPPSRAQQLQGLKVQGRISHTTLRSLVK
jgi:hypothetical protein